ncbi:unnamed protein product [Diamesa tonsa]
MNSMECWDYTIELECLQGPQDLQLAAELGKTLLERNKELESLLKRHQHLNEDQAQEIEHLTKQNAALREVNDSRLRIYETLDISIQELEYEKHQLQIDSSSDKKHIKNLNQTIESLESRCEDLSKQMEDLSRCLDLERRKNERLNDTISDQSNSRLTFKLRHVSRDGNGSEPDTEEVSLTERLADGQNIAFMDNSSSKDNSGIAPNSHDTIDSGYNASHTNDDLEHTNDEFLKVITEFETTKRHLMSEHHRVAELEHQISVIAQENLNLQSRLTQVNTIDEMKSVHEELSFLEDVRQGQMCNRCIKCYDHDRMVPTENTSYIGTEGDDDDHSLIDLLNSSTTQPSPPTYRSAVTIKNEELSERPSTLATAQYNPYKELVDKYEALLEVQKSSRNRPQLTSLQDELMTSGDFTSFTKNYTSDEESNKMSQKSTGVRRKTPDFSEVETTSSGFSDETSNKATQTDERSGAFLCTIADGEDCKFTIYDDASPIDSRFRDVPKYRDLFKEIFTVLKKAAENKEDGEKLPLLDDQQPDAIEAANNKVPPVTPATEDMPCDFDSQSVMSSAMSEHSIAVSECITKTERRKAKQHKKQAAKEPQDELENKPPVGVQMLPSGKLVTPYNRQALEYLAVSTKRRTRRSRQRSKDKYAESPATPTTLTRNKKGRRHHQQMLQAFSTINAISPAEWNGHSVTIYNRNAKGSSSAVAGFRCRPDPENTSEIEFKHSAASHELKKLKKLDLSYAEVLRRSDAKKRWNGSRHHNKHRYHSLT